jgi:hypothetical protein
MVVAGYGFLDSLPGGVPPPYSDWDGLRRIKISRLEEVVDNEWASWSLPGIVCYGDSGAPTFFYDHPLAGRGSASLPWEVTAVSCATPVTTARGSTRQPHRTGYARR